MAVARILAVCAVPDQQTGLYVALVTDERGVSLGLVWSSDESIAEVLRTETGVYPCIKTGSAGCGTKDSRAEMSRSW